MEESRAIKRYTSWINAKGIQPELRKELLNIISSPEEITDRFEQSLEFGTAGLRAVMAAGSNRINIYTIAAATQGLAMCIKNANMSDAGVVISYDSRNNSKEYAEVAARILVAAGVKVFLSDDIRPVPMVSFAIPTYEAAGGIMITASHNPKEYNGFKVYGSDGAQLSPAGAEAVRNNIPEALDMIEVLGNAPTLDDGIRMGLIQMLDKEWDDAYVETIKRKSASNSIADAAKERLRIVYSPLNGAGSELVRRVLSELGYARVFMVSEQAKPNGDFPTVRVPNPEYEDAYDIAKKYAKAVLADIIITTDPDADRLGIAVVDDNGDYKVLSGNQIGLLLMEYILSTKSGNGTLPVDSYCAASIVSSRLSRSICQRYGVGLEETITGSRYIAAKIKERSETGDSFQFGFEEGNGYMFGDAVLEKDAIRASVAIAEMAALSKSYGLRLYDQLKAIYKMYGYAAEQSFSITREGAKGQEAIEHCMNHYRFLEGKLGAIGQDLYYKEVRKFTDKMPEANVLVYELGDLDWIAIRPSGTEPKIKVYFGFYGERFAAESRLSRISQMLLEDINKVLDEVN